MNLIKQLVLEILKELAEDRKDVLQNYEGPVAHDSNITVDMWSINPKTKTITFSCIDRGPSGSGKPHMASVQLADHKYLSRDSDMTDQDKVDLAITAGEWKMYCDCESFQYGGFQYITWILKQGIRRELRRPRVNNPLEEGLSCKHLHAVAKTIDKFIPKIAEVFANARKNRYRTVMTED